MNSSDPQIPNAAVLADLLRRLNHDVRTPLVVIDGFARLMADERPLRDADRIEFATRIRGATVELRQLVEDARSALSAHVETTPASEPLVHPTPRCPELSFVAVVEPAAAPADIDAAAETPPAEPQAPRGPR